MDNRRLGKALLHLVVLALGILPGIEATAQNAEEQFDETSFVPLEQNINLEGTTGIYLLDDTRTKNGRDFYEYFYQQWLSIQTDTTLISPTAFSDIGEELTVSVDEQPIPGGIGTSTAVSLKINDVLIYQQFLQPRSGILELMAEDAANMLTQYIQNYQEFQSQLGSDDQQGNGIY